MTPKEKNYVYQGWLDQLPGHPDYAQEYQLTLEFYDGTTKSYVVTLEHAVFLITEIQASTIESDQWYEPAYIIGVPTIDQFTGHMGTWFQVYHEQA